MKYFQFLSYDVWGNAKDGWEVNDLSSMGLFILVEGWDTLDEAVFSKVAKKLVMRPRFQCDVEWLDDTMAEMTRPSGLPIGRFQEVEESQVGGRWGYPFPSGAQVMRISSDNRVRNVSSKW